MCGIVGYIGKEKAVSRIINGLKLLEYRGYDSAGVAYFQNDKIVLQKEVGRIAALEKLVDKDVDSYVGIGHTRWATHGAVTKQNAHPHQQGKFTVVHNGIIENYLELKNRMEASGYKFTSDTDTEVIPTLLDYYYRQENDVLKSIQRLEQDLEGSYAIGILVEDDPKHLYALRSGSPLIVAHDESGYFIASDVPAILNYTNKYYLIDEREVVKLSVNEMSIFDSDLTPITKEELTFEGNPDNIMLKSYPHYMLKEIHEEDQVFLDTLNYYVANGTFKETMPEFKKYKEIHIVACGSAYYVGNISKYLIEEYANIPVTVEVASEYRYKKNFYDKETLIIIISQSGETADSLAALRKAKEDGIDTLAIVNVVGSSIAREALYTLYVKAGCEIAVATTKAFLAQVTLMALFTIKISGRLDLLKHFLGLEEKIRELLARDDTPYAKIIAERGDTFFIGRLVDYALCLEGSLKLKETSYINSVAFQAGELKHGTISLISDGTPVVGICTDSEIYPKTVSNLKEVKARLAYVLFITNEEKEEDFYDAKILIPKVEKIVTPILTAIPLQLIAYEVAKLRGCDIDKPRNLAKSVTVE